MTTEPEEAAAWAKLVELLGNELVDKTATVLQAEDGPGLRDWIMSLDELNLRTLVTGLLDALIKRGWPELCGFRWRERERDGGGSTVWRSCVKTKDHTSIPHEWEPQFRGVQ